MENYEKDELWREAPDQEQEAPDKAQPVYEAPVYQQPYHGAGTGRKESPFANSPYMMNHSQPEPAADRYEQPYVPPVPPQKPKKVKKSVGKTWKTILCAVLALAVIAGSCGLTAFLVNEHWEDETEEMMTSLMQRMDTLQAQIDAEKVYPETIYQDASLVMSPGAVYQKNEKTVVRITAKVSIPSMFGQTTTGQSSGSGFVLTEDGYVVTNHHVIENATAVTVVMHDGTQYAAKVIGSDANNDVALLKIEEDVTLQAVEVGSSDALNVGDQVIAIGNPLGEVTATLTVGYVSAKGRDVITDNTTINMIQTDAAINSGSSGGPLFNNRGEVVGITTAKYSGESSSGASIEGVSFAIPIDDVNPLIDDLMNYGYINSAYLGVMVTNTDESTASYYGLPVGAYVQEVTPGYCAEKAGLQEKDIIVALGSYKVKNVSELTKALRKFKAGETTTITVYRAGQELSLTITLDEKPRTTPAEIPSYDEDKMPQEGNFEDWYNFLYPYFNEKG